MNKRIVDKVKVFFLGLWSRMEENKEFFQEINVLMNSGAREYSARIYYENDKIYFSYLGSNNEVHSVDDCTLFSELLNYDSARISYLERGHGIYIDADGKGVTMKHGDNKEKNQSPKLSSVKTDRAYFVNPQNAGRLLMELGILAPNGKIKNDKVRKYNQIDYFVELMSEMLKEIPEKDELLIMDCACGKSYLSFVLNYYLVEVLKKKCRFVGIDYSETVIDASKQMAKNLGYNNMEFIREDLTTYTPSTVPDIVVSLHACDTATDMALALGIRAKAKAIMSVPCCHKDILKQYSYEPFSAITRHGILKARLADTLTDGLRAAYLSAVGYNVSLIEYISPLETPKNIMIRALRTGKKNKNALDEYTNLKNLINVSPAIEKYAETN